MAEINQSEIGILLDKQAIHEVLMRYCRGIDRVDKALLKSAYHPGAWDDHGEFKGAAEEFIDWVIGKLKNPEILSTNHAIANEYVEVRGDVAFSEAYFVAYQRYNLSGKLTDVFVGARYVDKLERRNGEWRIARRTVVHDWTRQEPVGEVFERARLFRQAARSPEDESYRRDW
jgi:hypothetical protein